MLAIGVISFTGFRKPTAKQLAHFPLFCVRSDCVIQDPQNPLDAGLLESFLESNPTEKEIYQTRTSKEYDILI